jgi:hypothetical protein
MDGRKSKHLLDVGMDLKAVIFSDLLATDGAMGFLMVSSASHGQHLDA